MEHAESVSLRQGINKKLNLLDPRYVLPTNISLTPRCLNFMPSVREKVEEKTYFTTDLWSIVLIIIIEWKYKYLHR